MRSRGGRSRRRGWRRGGCSARGRARRGLAARGRARLRAAVPAGLARTLACARWRRRRRDSGRRRFGLRVEEAQLTQAGDRRRDRSHECRCRREISRCRVIPLLLRGLRFVCHPVRLCAEFRVACFRILWCAEGEWQRGSARDRLTPAIRSPPPRALPGIHRRARDARATRRPPLRRTSGASRADPADAAGGA